MFLVVLASVWQQISYNFLFFLAALQSIPRSLVEAAAIDGATGGGPVQSTTTLIYKIYREGFAGLDLSSSAAQSVILMLLVIGLTVIQFRFIERKVRYQ